MRYVEFRDAILDELRRCPDGLTWPQLRHRLAMPYRSPCYEWLGRLERRHGLIRRPGPGRAHVWRIEPEGNE